MSTRSASDGLTADAEPWHRVVLAFDGSASADQAMRWAIGEADAREAAIRVVACGPVPATADFDPRGALLHAASDADLLIVGASVSGGAERWLLSSIPQPAARRSPCSVVVVRGQSRQPLQRIVVGVDSSNAAAAALDWAVDEADRHDAELFVLHAWQRPDGSSRSVRGNDLARADAQCIVDLAVRQCEKRTSRAVRGGATEGEATAVLTTASKGADLLAVGSRGRSGFKRMLFGSVALSVADRASCPVAVIHPHLRPA